ncbi:5-histidylcysteine sulfoxide synthase [Thiomicrorhabdus aquaedulcis]|uniref:5-histidylcysteine sulfoxide synthase n=1 Tax=Thiomicrorhabdus aquaedulcis TaxID=2211106 RepID=UPI000FDA8E5B|nr:5-histidylcysteine sulfoxide synthase [Thiomicrorhabdus aquaedulcis]
MLSRAELVAQPLLLNQGNVQAKRAEIKAYFNQTQDTYEALFTTLACDQAFYERPCSLRHPLIFYFGHTATFFTNKLVLAKLLPQRINPHIESLCAIGVDEMSWDDLNDAHYDWPTVAQVRTYRAQVREAINTLIDQVEFSLPIDWQSPMWPIMMGIEHERIHLETSSVLIRQLPIHLVVPSALFPVCPHHGHAPENILFDVPPGLVNIDHTDPVETYGWDNEYGQHQAHIDAFKAAAFLVSNQEYLDFVDADGYHNPQYWDDEGNRWREFSPVKHPTFWLKKADQWHLRCMTDEIAMPWNWPVEVNALEAAAFCRWKSQQTGRPLRLPSEDEYLRLRDHTQAQTHVHLANVNLQHFASSVAVNTVKTGDFFDVIGNVWQWTQTPIYPFTGFKVHPLYDDFTTPTFDNKHNLFKGGSWISTGNEINGHSRYAFRRHFFQHAGFRYIESNHAVQTQFITYETDPIITQPCEFNYGDAVPNLSSLPNLAQACAQHAINALQTDAAMAQRQAQGQLNVLDVGCSVGRSSFELARYANQVTGLDFSARFIKVANQLKERGSILYTLPLEGDIMDFKERTLDALGLSDVAQKCTFLQQDAANLKPIFSGYDLIMAVNLLEKLYQPRAFLATQDSRLNPGGLLVLSSTYQWDTNITAKTEWLGGYKDTQSGENVTSLEGLQAALKDQFELIHTHEQAFAEYQNLRHAHCKTAQITVWKKRSVS